MKVKTDLFCTVVEAYSWPLDNLGPQHQYFKIE